MVWSVSKPHKRNRVHWAVHVLAEILEEPQMERYIRRRTGIRWSDNVVGMVYPDTKMYKPFERRLSRHHNKEI